MRTLVRGVIKFDNAPRFEKKLVPGGPLRKNSREKVKIKRKRENGRESKKR